MSHSKEYLGIEAPTLGDLQRAVAALTEEQLDFAVPKLKEWRERAIELQLEPAAMAVGMLQLTEERDKWKCAAEQLRIIGEGIIGELDAAWLLADEDLSQQCDLWSDAVVGDPWPAT